MQKSDTDSDSDSEYLDSVNPNSARRRVQNTDTTNNIVTDTLYNLSQKSGSFFGSVAASILNATTSVAEVGIEAIHKSNEKFIEHVQPAYTQSKQILGEKIDKLTKLTTYSTDEPSDTTDTTDEEPAPASEHDETRLEQHCEPEQNEGL